MAILQDEQTEHRLYLRALHVFGRNPAKADTLLGNADASQIHASIRWTGALWELLDHSRNGTLVDGTPMTSNGKQPLAVGQKIRFGPVSTTTWVVKNLDPPCAMLQPEHPDGSDGDVILLKTIHFLPDESAPEASVYRSALGQWILETAEGDRVLQDGDLIEVAAAGRRYAWRFIWRLFASNEFEVTMNVREFGAPAADGVFFDFTVSQNEEHILLTISSDGKSVSLGERTHHYSLLTLARTRFQDAERGLDVSSQGWLSIEQMSRMLGLEQSHLNTQLFRARNQIAREFSKENNLENVIERRRGEVRFGAFRFRIVRGDRIEAVFTPVLPGGPGQQASTPLPPIPQLAAR